MQHSARPRLRRAYTVAIIALTAGFVAACASPEPKGMVNNRKRSKEYFAETEYGVKASPRPGYMRRGGGRDQVGKPYKVKGKWYYPKEDKNYKKTGTASWYGDAFHGRLTANGEIYDMTHLTAAHPTMPLPSYARVTNVENGSSVIVRVNDRGPYAHNRLIDLSKRAAEMLDYTHGGTAQVKVEYVGRAPLEGHDDKYLMASYRPGNRAPDPSDGLPTGVMIAMNGPTPSVGVGAATAFPGTLTDSGPAPSMPVMTASADGTLGGFADLPAFGPIVPERPGIGSFGTETQVAMATMSYSAERMPTSVKAFAALEGGMSSDDVLQSWKRLNRDTAAASPQNEAYVAVGSFADENEAGRLARALSGFGRTALERSEEGGRTWYSLNLYATDAYTVDQMLEAAWANGATDAIPVRE